MSIDKTISDLIESNNALAEATRENSKLLQRQIELTTAMFARAKEPLPPAGGQIHSGATNQPIAETAGEDSGGTTRKNEPAFKRKAAAEKKAAEEKAAAEAAAAASSEPAAPEVDITTLGQTLQAKAQGWLSKFDFKKKPDNKTPATPADAELAEKRNHRARKIRDITLTTGFTKLSEVVDAGNIEELQKIEAMYVTLIDNGLDPLNDDQPFYDFGEEPAAEEDEEI